MTLNQIFIKLNVFRFTEKVLGDVNFTYNKTNTARSVNIYSIFQPGYKHYII